MVDVPNYPGDARDYLPEEDNDSFVENNFVDSTADIGDLYEDPYDALVRKLAEHELPQYTIPNGHELIGQKITKMSGDRITFENGRTLLIDEIDLKNVSDEEFEDYKQMLGDAYDTD